MEATKSGWLLFFSLWTLVAGGAVCGLGVWNGLEVAWSNLSTGIVGAGAVLVVVSIHGILVSRGCVCCCYIGLHLYTFLMGLLVLGEAAFIVAAGIKESDWIAEMARKYAGSQDNVDHLKDKYDQFWPYVLGFGAVTFLGCLGGFLAAYFMRRRAQAKYRERNGIIGQRPSRRTRGGNDPYKNIVMELSRKYGIQRSPDQRRHGSVGSPPSARTGPIV